MPYPLSLALRSKRTIFISRALTAGAAEIFTVLAIVSMAPAARAQVVSYVGSDIGAAVGDPRPNSNAAAASYDAAASGLGTAHLINFESTPLGTFTSLTVAPGVTLTGADHSGNAQTIENAPQGPAGNSNVFGYNTTAGGANFVYLQGGNVVFTFSQPVDAFGGYFTGVQPNFTTDTVTFSDGTSQSLTIPGGNPTGGSTFVGFTDAGKSISSVMINASNGAAYDDIGVDDVRYTTAAPAVTATPEPGAVLTVASMFGMTGLGLVRGRIRRRRAGTAV